MLSEFKLVCNSESLSKSDIGQSITGAIYFQVNGEFFPGRHWIDFPVVIISWWLTEVQKLNKGESNGEDLDFMDGPIKVRAEKMKDSDSIMLHFDDVQLQIPCSEFLAILRATANQILSACSSRGWQTNDMTELRLTLGAASPLTPFNQLPN